MSLRNRAFARLTTWSWDKCYQDELENGLGQEDGADLTDLESWFSEIDAPAKILDYLTDEHFPLSPNNSNRTTENRYILDLGCGNGSSLFELKLEGAYQGKMVGADYSQQSIDLARRLWTKHIEQHTEEDETPTLQAGDITFEKFDLLRDKPSEQAWWPERGFDLVTDKGTFDAISLSSETINQDGKDVRICEVYPSKAAQMVKPGGYLLITSVNWTEEEVVRWFTETEGAKGVLTEYGRVKYPVYEYGGRRGQGVTSVCFRRGVPS